MWPLLSSMLLLPLPGGACALLLLVVAPAVPLLPETCASCSTHLRRVQSPVLSKWGTACTYIVQW